MLYHCSCDLAGNENGLRRLGYIFYHCSCLPSEDKKQGRHLWDLTLIVSACLTLILGFLPFTEAIVLRHSKPNMFFLYRLVGLIPLCEVQVPAVTEKCSHIVTEKKGPTEISVLYTNICSLICNFDPMKGFSYRDPPDVIVLAETWVYSHEGGPYRLENYNGYFISNVITV